MIMSKLDDGRDLPGSHHSRGTIQALEASLQLMIIQQEQNAVTPSGKSLLYHPVTDLLSVSFLHCAASSTQVSGCRSL